MVYLYRLENEWKVWEDKKALVFSRTFTCEREQIKQNEQKKTSCLLWLPKCKFPLLALLLRQQRGLFCTSIEYLKNDFKPISAAGGLFSERDIAYATLSPWIEKNKLKKKVKLLVRNNIDTTHKIYKYRYRYNTQKGYQRWIIVF